MSGVQGRGLSVCAPRLPGFILLVGFSGALLVLSALDMVLWLPLGAAFTIDGSYESNGSFLAWGWPFPGCGGAALRSGAYPAGGLRWSCACGFGFGYRL